MGGPVGASHRGRRDLSQRESTSGHSAVAAGQQEDACADRHRGALHRRDPGGDKGDARHEAGRHVQGHPIAIVVAIASIRRRPEPIRRSMTSLAVKTRGLGPRNINTGNSDCADAMSSGFCLNLRELRLPKRNRFCNLPQVATSRGPRCSSASSPALSHRIVHDRQRRPGCAGRQIAQLRPHGRRPSTRSAASSASARRRSAARP